MSQTRLFDDNMYRFDTPQQSYWEATGGTEEFSASPLDRDESCDVAIIGGGYTGLSAALHLARDHEVDVRVVEAGHIGWGASGRNGGFCAVGGTALHRGALIRHAGLDSAKAFYRASVDAVELVRSLASDEDIDYQACGNAEIEVAHSKRAAKSLLDDLEALRALEISAEYISADECRERFFTSTECHGALINRPAFGLHPLRYSRGLAAAAARHGVVLHAHSRVDRWQKSEGVHRLEVPGGVLRAKRIIVASNGFLQEDLDRRFYGRTLPVISAIVVTRPLTDDELVMQEWVTEDPSFNTLTILNYFRLLPDKRFLFGGRGHSDGEPRGEAKTYEALTARMRRIWPCWSEVDIEYRWHGLICYTSRLAPAVGRLPDDDSIYFGFGYHGNGVNMASWAGKVLADWIGTGRKPTRLPELISGLPKRFPMPKLRPLVFRLGVSVAKLYDRFS